VDKRTERTWKSKCASCHGADGIAQTDQGKKFGIKDYATPAFHAVNTDAGLKKAIVDAKGQNMPAYKDLAELSDQLVQVLRSLKKQERTFTGPIPRRLPGGAPRTTFPPWQTSKTAA
jgi:mono/diheme cytochrome c family protein